eukprot:3187052-Prymnesium_polylepis.1
MGGESPQLHAVPGRWVPPGTSPLTRSASLTMPPRAAMSRSVSLVQLARSASSSSLQELSFGRRRSACCTVLMLLALFVALLVALLGGAALYSEHGADYALHRFRPNWRARPLSLCVVLDETSSAERAMALALAGLLRALARHDADIVVLELPEA